jgi:regulator of protease activity HflC (stomatin/prohibitin superfamily)
MTVMSTIVAIVLLVLIVGLALITLLRSVRIVPQARAGIVERFGRYHRTLHAGLNLVVPFIDRLRPLIDLREQVVSFPPQPVITKDNLVVGIDTVIYFQVTDPRAATYEIANYVAAVEQLTVTTLRNVVGGMDLDTTLTSRDKINGELRRELDEATGKWGLRVSRVELKAIEPPSSIQDSMEKQMRADRDKRAAILSAEGAKQSAILTAEGERQAAVLRARGEAEAAVGRAARRRLSRRSSAPSTRAIRTSGCWPTSTSRCCRRSPGATRTSCGSCPARWARRLRGSAPSSARRATGKASPRARTKPSRRCPAPTAPAASPACPSASAPSLG